MILKMCNPGIDRHVECDMLHKETTSDPYAVAVYAYRSGVEVGRWRIGSSTLEPTCDFVRAYVMDGGKTVDRIQP